MDQAHVLPPEERERAAVVGAVQVARREKR